MRTVSDISRDDRERIATCSLLTATDRLKKNYSIANEMGKDIRHTCMRNEMWTDNCTEIEELLERGHNTK